MAKILANWQGWFQMAGGKHRAGIYDSYDPKIISGQIRAAMKVGISGFVVDWYGGISDQGDPTNKATLQLKSLCEYMGFEFSIMLDAGLFRYRPIGTQMAAVVAETKYALQTYASSPAYTRFNGLPLFWEFGLREYGIDIPKFTTQVGSPIFLLSQFSLAHGAQGTFAWVNGFSPSSITDYLDKYATNPKNKLDVPVLFAGFDDHNPAKPEESIWGGPARKIPWSLETFKTCLDHASKSTSPIRQICTWNDYEEGSQVETTVKAITGVEY
jgi:hypothetical protein